MHGLRYVYVPSLPSKGHGQPPFGIIEDHPSDIAEQFVGTRSMLYSGVPKEDVAEAGMASKHRNININATQKHREAHPEAHRFLKLLKVFESAFTL